LAVDKVIAIITRGSFFGPRCSIQVYALCQISKFTTDAYLLAFENMIPNGSPAHVNMKVRVTATDTHEAVSAQRRKTK